VSGARVPLRHSLVARLLITSVLIAIAAIAATAWLATRTATRAINQEQGRSLAEDKGVYDLLVEYAAAHRDWTGVPAPVDARAAELGRRITLLTKDRTVIADSAEGRPLPADRASATVDPLDLDLGLTGGHERIDARIIGPFLVPPAERTRLWKQASDELSCLRKHGADGSIQQLPSGWSVVALTTPDPGGRIVQCRGEAGDATYDKALRTLGRTAARCLDLPDGLTVEVSPGYSAALGTTEPGVRKTEAFRTAEALFKSGNAAGAERIHDCVDKSRRTMLQPYVAPPALLFITDPGTGADRTRFTLSSTNIVRIATTTGAVLLATIVVTVLVGRRLVRPLRALTEAADQQTPAPVTTRDEIGRLARALNDSAARRDRAETLRRAIVSDVAHELRTPLTNIRSWLEAAQDNLAPTDAELLDLLHDETVLLQHIIDDLGDLAAADAGTLRVHPEPTHLRDVLTQVVDSHLAPAQAAGVRLTTEIHGDPVVTVDGVRLRQIVGNLVSNGIRYTPRGGTVTVGARDTTITVRDTGVGIAAADLPRVFDRFWRADESRSRATGGRGLGLAIAHELAEAHDATLEVQSEPGRGTVFTLRLPPAAGPAGPPR
jgi:two-component system sensor histidine kinase BaeS